jgi:hypothetical protein
MRPAERETVVQFDDEDSKATIYTCHKRWQSRLKRLGFTPERPHGGAGLIFRIPKTYLGMPRRPRKSKKAL